MSVGRSLSTVLFDLDGTLVRLRRRGLELRFMAAAILRFARGIPPWRFRRAFWSAIDTMQHHHTDDCNYDVLVSELTARSRWPRQRVDEQLQRLVAEDFARLSDRFVPIPGARDTLRHAQQLGYRVVLATNPVWPAAAVRMRLRWGGLGDFRFDFVSHSEVMTRCKPDPAYFHELLRKLEATPGECLMIGNDPTKDLPAKDVGIATYLVQHPGAPLSRQALADPRLDGWGSFAQLRAVLADASERRTEEPTRAPMMERPKLVCVTGPDGAGKTTQITRLAERIAHRGGLKSAAVTIWDLLLDPETASKVGFKSPKHVDRFLEILSPTSRALFLFHCLNEAMVRAQRGDVDVLLLNAYWYKYYAAEVAHGGDAAQILRLADEVFREPELTFYLRVEPAEAFRRKATISGYESGFAKTKDEASFVAFQQRAHAALDELARDRGWIELNGNESSESLTDVILERIDAEA